MINCKNRIMVIDDDIQVRECVSLFLKTAGYTVMAAESSKEGLYQQEKFQASLVIMDVVALKNGENEPIHLPGKHSASIPMITLTGNIPSSDGTTRSFIKSFQPICTLQKPFTVDELLQTVQRVLSR